MVAFPAYEHAKFVAVLRGGFDLQIEGESTPIRLRRGDCYMLTNGTAYRIFNADVAATDAASLYAADSRIDGVVRWGEGVVDTVNVGSRKHTLNSKGAAWFRVDRLPPLIRIPAGTAEAALLSCHPYPTLRGSRERTGSDGFRGQVCRDSANTVFEPSTRRRGEQQSVWSPGLNRANRLPGLIGGAQFCGLHDVVSVLSIPEI